MRNIQDLREMLFDTIQGVKNGTVSVEKGRVIGDLSRVMTETAKAEVAFLQTTKGKSSPFLAHTEKVVLPPGITGVTKHTIEG